MLAGVGVDMAVLREFVAEQTGHAPDPRRPLDRSASSTHDSGTLGVVNENTIIEDALATKVGGM